MLLTVLIIKEAINKGYRVTEDGLPYRFDEPLELNIDSTYPTITIETIYSKTEVCNLPAKQLAAYCFYGNETFKRGQTIKHLDGNVCNLSKSNLVLDSLVAIKIEDHITKRSQAASIARASQGKTPTNAKLDEKTRQRIIRLRKLKYSYSVIALKFNVHKSTIHNLVTKKTYSD